MGPVSGVNSNINGVSYPIGQERMLGSSGGNHSNENHNHDTQHSSCSNSGTSAKRIVVLSRKQVDNISRNSRKNIDSDNNNTMTMAVSGAQAPSTAV